MHRVVVVGLVCVAGCTESLVDGVFTEDEWAFAQTFRHDQLPSLACTDCAVAVAGQQLFFDPALSRTGTVACATCHDPAHYFADSRPGGTSFGLDWTKRNTLSLVNVAQLSSLSWTGAYPNLVAVFDLPVKSAAALGMPNVADVVRGYDDFAPLFGPAATDDERYHRAAVVLAAYQAQLESGPAPFDRYLAGDVTAIDATAKRGLQVFMGRGLCSECHTGPLFTDEQTYNTSVPQTGAHVPATDDGSGDGRFRTTPLRNVAMTAPYMHTGDLATLADVIDFYRWGGHADPRKDQRILPLEIDDDDARALEAFLGTLTSEPLDNRWTHAPTP